jgi:RecA-family ATPase
LEKTAGEENDAMKIVDLVLDKPDHMRSEAAAAETRRTNEQQAPLLFVDMQEWDEQQPPARPWAVLDRIPLRQVSLLSGEGAVGKTILELQRGVAHVLGRDWIGTLPELGPVIYVNAEDEEDELRRRLGRIAAHYDARFADIAKGGLHLLSLAGKDAVLGHADRQGIVKPTPLFARLREAACDIKPKSVTLDTSADVFAGNENDRAQVRQFVGLLRGLAIDANSAVLVCSHPSLTGISSDTGLSGSTAWHNSVRARLYFKPATTEAGEMPDPDLRELQFKKNNYGPLSERVLLRWRNGVFVPEPSEGSLERMAADQKDDEAFLTLLVSLNEQGRNASPSANGSTYAPTLMKQDPRAQGISKRRLIDAMNRLFAARKIRVEPYGRPSRPNHRIVKI